MKQTVQWKSIMFARSDYSYKEWYSAADVCGAGITIRPAFRDDKWLATFWKGCREHEFEKLFQGDSVRYFSSAEEAIKAVEDFLNRIQEIGAFL